jgi:hypothetical protein
VLTIAEVFRFGLRRWARLKQMPWLSDVWLGLAAGLAGAMVSGVVDHYYFNIEFQGAVTMFWLFVGLSLAAARLAAPLDSTPTSPRQSQVIVAAKSRSALVSEIADSMVRYTGYSGLFLEEVGEYRRAQAMKGRTRKLYFLLAWAVILLLVGWPTERVFGYTADADATQPSKPFLQPPLEEPSLVLTGHDYQVTSLALSPNGSILASGSCAKLGSSAVGVLGVICVQGEILLWDTTSGQQISQALIGHLSSVSKLVFSPRAACRPA